MKNKEIKILQGELSHPDKFSSIEFSMWRHGGGEIIDKLAEQPFVVSSRGFGTVDENNVIKDYTILSYDMVMNPSFKSAKIQKLSIFKRIIKFIVKIFKFAWKKIK